MIIVVLRLQSYELLCKINKMIARVCGIYVKLTIRGRVRIVDLV